MNILITIILFGLLFWKLKNNFINRTTLAYEYKFQAISFKLDMLVVNDKIKADNYKYKTLSTNICSINSKLQYLNLVVLFFYFLHDRKKKSRLPAKQQFNSASISKKEQKINAELSKIEKEFNDTLFEYIVRKNVGFKIVALAIYLGVTPVKRFATKLSAKLKDYLQYFIEKPLYRQTVSPKFSI